MGGERSRYGLVVAAVGAGLLVVSLLLPWYRARHAGPSVGSPPSVSGAHALGGLVIVLVVLCGLALLDTLVPLVRSRASHLPEGAGASLVLLGVVAGACVLFRIVYPPAAVGRLVSLSPREGAWIALAGAAMMLAGGVWRRDLWWPVARRYPVW
jgi:hypothetical protein